MSTDQDRRVQAAVRDLADAVPVVPPSPTVLRARVPARPGGSGLAGARWLTPALAAAAVLVLAAPAVVVGWFWQTAPPTPATAGERPVLPEDFAEPSWLTASVVDHPPGPASATFTTGDELVVVGVDGRTYRQLDLTALYEVTDGRALRVRDPVLSPDGSRLAGVGGFVIDLTRGSGGWFPVVAGDTEVSYSAAPFAAWSTDSRWAAYTAYPDRVVLLDVNSGERRILETGGDIDQLAFSPDGREVAVATGGEIVIFDLSGNRRRELDLAATQQLAGGTAWSPDGRYLAVQEPTAGWGTRFSFLDATGSGAPVPAPVELALPRVLLGWRSPGVVLVGHAEWAGGPTSIAEVPLDGSPDQQVSWPPAGVANLHLASGLLAEVEIRDAGPPRWGPLPASLRTAAVVLAGALVVLVVAVAWRRGRRGRRA
jgi:dipeptidyl aminopeptidase/acylaminoacyl peptidase